MKNHLKSPRKLLVKDQSTRPTQLPMKKGSEAHEGWLIPTTSWMAGNNKQDATRRWEPSIHKNRIIKSLNYIIYIKSRVSEQKNDNFKQTHSWRNRIRAKKVYRNISACVCVENEELVNGVHNTAQLLNS